jgi:hypothetical protein
VSTEHLTRRGAFGAIAASLAAARLARAQGHSEDAMTTIVRNARVSTLDPSRPEAEALAIRDGSSWRPGPSGRSVRPRGTTRRRSTLAAGG